MQVAILDQQTSALFGNDCVFFHSANTASLCRVIHLTVERFPCFECSWSCADYY